MSDEARDEAADGARWLRDELDRELARLVVTDDSRRRLRGALVRRPPRWPVAVVTATVVALIAAPGLVVRSMRTGATAVATPSAVLPGGAVASSTGTVPTTAAVPGAATSSERDPDGRAPAPATTRPGLLVTPREATAGTPVVLTMQLVVEGSLDRRAGASAAAPSPEARPTGVPARSQDPSVETVRLDWGDATAGDQRLICPGFDRWPTAVPVGGATATAQQLAVLSGTDRPGTAGVRKRVPASHVYRRPGTYVITMTFDRASCWPGTERLTATVVVR